VSKKTLVRVLFPDEHCLVVFTKITNFGVMDTMTLKKMSGKDTEKFSSEAQSSPFGLQW
jgi:hypothetical protein